MRELKTFAQIEVGEEFDPVEYDLAAEMILKQADAVEDYNPWYREDSPFGGPIALPTITCRDYLPLLLGWRYAFAGIGILAKHEAEFLYPARPGSRITVRGKIADKYVRRGRPYIVIECSSVDEEGREITRTKHTVMLVEFGATKGGKEA